MDFLFAEEDKENDTLENNNKWNILIVDDEPEIHAVTKLALNDFSFEQKKLNFISAYSGKEAIEKMNKYGNSISVIFLDIVMETDNAGIDVIRYIRDESKNKQTRIILRTGQPGTNPEQKIIENYDINDYKNKTELSAQKLRTSILSSLRAYDDMMHLEKYKNIVTNIANNSGKLFNVDSVEEFKKIALKRILSLCNEFNFDKKFDYFTISKTNTENYEFNESSEYYKNIHWDNFNEYNSLDLKEKIKDSINYQNHVIYENYIIIHYGAKPNEIDYYNYITVIEFDYEINEETSTCISLLSSNLNNFFQNMIFKKEVKESQNEIISLLGNAIENRSEESGNHVKRVASISKLLAKKMGFSKNESELVFIASSLHDLGKVAIPDCILHKKGKLTSEEKIIMNQHVEIGYSMLKSSKHKVLKYAAIIANEHHEKFDGTGYPNQKKGKDINILGRITAIGDVFDALLNKRCYKRNWEVEEVLDFIKKEKGKHFDPLIVDVFFKNIEEIKKIREDFPD